MCSSDLGVVEGGELRHVTALGLADREASRVVTRATAFRIASMTKSVTALAILALRDRAGCNSMRRLRSTSRSSRQ